MRKVTAEINDQLYIVFYPDREFVIVVLEKVDGPKAHVMSFDELEQIVRKVQDGQTVPNADG